MSDTKKKALDFLNKNHLGVVATASKKGLPHASSVFFLCESDFDIYFLTKTETTKFRNISENPHVSLVVTDSSKHITLQLHGLATKVDDTEIVRKKLDKLAQIITDYSEVWPAPVSKMDAGSYVVIHIKTSDLSLGDFRWIKDHDHSDYFERITL